MNKKMIKGLLMGLTLSMSIVCYAKDTNIKMEVDGVKVEFNEETGYPFIDKNHRMQIPFRVALEKADIEVKWGNNTAIGIKDGIKVEVPIGKRYIVKNGKKVETDTEAQIIDGKTYLPIRAVMEAFEYKVNLKDETLLIENSNSENIGSKEQIVPKVSVNGEEIVFSDEVGYPFYEAETIYVPIWEVSRKLNIPTKNIVLNYDNAMITNGDKKVELFCNESYILVNGDKKQNLGSAKRIGNEIYAPIEAVAEAFGYETLIKDNVLLITQGKIESTEIEKYNIPEGLGKAKLSSEQIKQLSKQSPEEIKNKITTVSDLIQYMINVNYKSVSGDIQKKSGDYSWSYNIDGVTTLKANEGNCGATANLVNYILEGDYDEVGFIQFSADSGQGGHVYNYIKENNKYYFIDFLQYPMAEYQRYDYEIEIFDNLKDYPTACINAYGGDKDIKIIVAYTADEQLPIGNNIKKSKGDSVGRFYPKSAKENVQVLYETSNEGKIVEFIELPNGIVE